MTAKERLQNIKLNRAYIKSLEARRYNLKQHTSVKAIDYSAIKVQTSNSNSFVETQAIDNIERTQAIEAKIMEIMLDIDKTLDDIYQCDGGICSQVLYMHYEENKSFKAIAAELDYDYHYICSIHSKALKAFDKYCNNKEAKC